MKVVILTCNRNAWIVPIFLHFYEKYWPDNPYQTEIITETDHIDGKVFYTGGASWSSGLLNYLRQSEEDKFLLILEDYFINRTVDTKRVKLAEETCEGNIGCVSLFSPVRYQNDHTIKSNIDGFGEYPLDKKYSASIQPAIWQKRYLFDVLREKEDAWQAEVNGSERLKKLKSKWRLLWADPQAIECHHGTLISKGVLQLAMVKWAMLDLLNDK